MKRRYYKNDASKSLAITLLNNAIEIAKSLFPQQLIKKLVIHFNCDLINNSLERKINGTCTPSKDLEQIRLEFDPNYIAGKIEKEKLEDIQLFITKIVRHEFFHAYQFLWLIEHGGQKAIDNYFNYKDFISYEQNILEQGAHNFENPYNCKIQNFDRDLKFLLK